MGDLARTFHKVLGRHLLWSFAKRGNWRRLESGPSAPISLSHRSPTLVDVIEISLSLTVEIGRLRVSSCQKPPRRMLRKPRRHR
jgi:hypothetical protein